MKEILFSIIVPVYNVEGYLQKCVDSILNQTFQDYELLLIDDGSLDDSGKICDMYKSQYSNIKVIHQENQGQLSARRTGLKLASGKYICFVDSDDFIHPELLQRAARIIQTVMADVITFKWSQIDADSHLIREEASSFCRGEVDKEEYFKKMLSSSTLNSLCKKICRRSLFDIDTDYSKNFSVQNGEDLLQSIPIIEHAQKIYYLDEVLYFYRINPKSITHQYNQGEYRVLNIVRPALYECMVRLGYDSEENRRLFFRFYLQSLKQKLYRLCANGVCGRAIFEEIYAYPLVREGRDYCCLLKPWLRMGVQLFYAKKWGFMNTLFKLEAMVRKLFGR